MRLLLCSDMASTGFGRVGRELGARFLQAGLDLRVIGINHRGRGGELLALEQKGAPSSELKAFLDEYDASPLWPITMPAFAAGDGMGHNLTAPAIRGKLWKDGWAPDQVLVVADPRAMVFRLRTDEGSLSTLPAFNYVPIEGSRLPPIWQQIWRHVMPVAMTDFGREQLETLLGREVPMIHHGVSPGFYPVSPSRPGGYRGQVITSKDAAKAVLGFAGKTVIFRCDRLTPRKDYPALFQSIAPVLQAHPEVLLVIHCAVDDEGGMLAEMLSHLPGSADINGSWQHPQVRLTKAHDTFRGLTDAELNVFYNAADIYASPTMAEGFGLTLAEAASCALPVVATDFGPAREVLGPDAPLVPYRTLFRNIYAHDWALVDEDAFTKKLMRLVEKPSERRSLGEAARKHVQRFTWDTAANEFLALFRDVPAAAAA